MKKEYCRMTVWTALAFVLAGCGRQEVREPLPVKVKVVKVQPASTAVGQRFSGTVEESSGSMLSFPVAGTVRRMHVETGRWVSRNELLAELDETGLQSTCDAAAATLAQAEDAYRRMKQLYDAGSLPEMQWTEVQSKLKQAQAMERLSGKNLADGRLCAPFAGIVSEKDVEVGQNVMPGQPVVRLVAIERVKVRISVPENEISHVRIGQPVKVCVSALDGKTFSGEVLEKGIAANPLSRSYEVKALVGNPSGELLPGMICTLELCREEKTEVLALPPRLLQTDEKNRTFVWVNDNGKARKRIVETGTLGKDGIVIVSGLLAGEEVLAEGQQKVSDGMNITLDGKE